MPTNASSQAKSQTKAEVGTKIINTTTTRKKIT